ncbi:hypothetical protein MG296_01235 [Flavobacteriaceae bacterium TK19130]|nr:hypothetical protein [Thermobacterium salinum]
MKFLAIPHIAAVAVLLMCTSCVKDTDFDQAEDITLTPVVELDLIYFDLTADDFIDPETELPTLTLRDTTELRFLDDSFSRESIRRADFYFEFMNSIPREFEVDFTFLRGTNNESTYQTATTVIAGSPQSPQQTIFEETVEGETIDDLTRASKVVVSVTIPSADASLEGSLNLQSKTTYYLEL